MLRILRAFAWMRWRVFVNSLERTGARDRLERFSLAIEQIGPIIAAVLTIPSMVALAGLGAAGGYLLATESGRSLLLEIVRYLLLAATGLSLVGPLLMPSADRTNAIRLLLLPIPRSTLYLSQVAAAVVDLWVLLAVPLVICIPLGLAAGGAFVSALLALAGGVLFVAILAGLTALSTTVTKLLVRDRRRSELIALAFIVILPVVGMLPGLLDASRRSHETGKRSRSAPPPQWVQTTAARAAGIVPSELYLRTTGFEVDDRKPSAARPLLALLATAVLLNGGGLFLFGKLLDSPGTTGVRRARGGAEVWGRTLPLLSPGASAVALAQLRLALRSSRGRSTLLSPVFVFLVFAILVRRAGAMEFGFTSIEGGLSVATFGGFMSLLATLPILMNQFAVDGAGLTLVLLSPLTDRELLTGKAAGNALIAFGPMMFCLLAAAAVFRTGSPAMWISIPLALGATYAVAAPLAAIFSAVFPRAVDMNSIGGRSNAHGLAGLLGLLSFAIGAAPSALVLLLATSVLRRPALTPLLLLVWCGVALVVSRLLFVPAERIFRERRENLALVV
jgi:hypothetical protein